MCKVIESQGKELLIEKENGTQVKIPKTSQTQVSVSPKFGSFTNGLIHIFEQQSRKYHFQSGM